MKLFTWRKKTMLEEEIDCVLETLTELDEDKDEYGYVLKNLERLYEIKQNENNYRVKPDTIFLVGGNLLGILLILHYERLNIITSKALTFVLRGRV